MVTQKEYELLLKRFRHLLESDAVRLYDEVDPRTKEYKRDIRELDTIIGIDLARGKDMTAYVPRSF